GDSAGKDTHGGQPHALSVNDLVERLVVNPLPRFRAWDGGARQGRHAVTPIVGPQQRQSTGSGEFVPVQGRPGTPPRGARASQSRTVVSRPPRTPAAPRA